MEADIKGELVFMWFDYGLFIMMLGSSILIGLYFGYCGHQDTADEYLLGGKSMSILPIATSLIASYISGISLLAVPADVYRFGVGYIMYLAPYIPIYLLTIYVYLPVFYKLQLVSTYEYLSLRFDRKIRLLSSFLYTLNNLFYLPIVVYVPALALAQATQIHLHIITPVLCTVCIFYTTIGGLKAVVWTDTLQFIIMMGSMIAVLIIGLKSVGGFGEVWKKTGESGRLDLNWSIDPTQRDSVMTVSLGTFFSTLSSVAVNQSFVQKYLSLPKLSCARKAIALLMFGLVITICFITMTGLLMHTRYFDCEPFAAGKINARDQILPFYVLDVARGVPGLAGLFLSGIFSAGLSTLSACLNSLAGTIYEDFLSSRMPKDITQKRVSDILKIIVVAIGLVCTALVFVVEHMGSIFPVQASLSGITIGPLLGLFTLGIVFPTANAKGALYGGLGSMAIMSYIIGGGQFTQLRGQWSYPDKPISVSGCTNLTLDDSYLKEVESISEVNPLFKISFYYYCFLGTISTIIIGVIVSYFTKDKNHKVDKDLISPVCHWMIKDETNKFNLNYYDINSAIKVQENY